MEHNCLAELSIVLILIVMDNGLSRLFLGGGTPAGGLNPYCNG